MLKTKPQNRHKFSRTISHPEAQKQKQAEHNMTFKKDDLLTTATSAGNTLTLKTMEELILKFWETDSVFPNPPTEEEKKRPNITQELDKAIARSRRILGLSV